MADDEEDLIVNLTEPETAPEGAAKVETKLPPVPGPSVTPEIGLKDLERQIEAERADRARLMQEAQQLQRERDEALQAVEAAQRQTGNNYEAWVESQINGMVSEMDTMAGQYEAAMSDGDFKSAAEINKRLGRVGGQLAIAEREKLVLQQQREQKAKQPQQQRRQQQPRQQQAVPTDPVERAIQGRSEPTKAFLRKHPDLIRGDGTLKKLTIDMHEKAMDAGHAVDTPEYFGFIENLLGSSGGNNGNAAEVSVPGYTPGYSAPVTRGPAPGGDSLAPGTFKMTPRMRRLAEEQGVTPQEWANNYIRLVKEGRMTPIT